MLRSTLLLAATLALMASVQTFGHTTTTGIPAFGICLAFGFLILVALQAGNLFEAVRLPRLTGYFIAGFLCGPQVSGLLNRPMVEGLRALSAVAVGLIALVAGCEISLPLLRARWKSIVLMGSAALVCCWVAVALVALALSPVLPFARDLTWVQRAVAASLVGLVLAAMSPTAILAILRETGSKGPLSESVLALVVFVDIAVVVLEALVEPFAGMAFHVDLGGVHPAREVMVSVLGSLGAGLVLAGVLALYTKRVGSKLGLFALAVVVVAARVGEAFHLDLLIVCLAAGVCVENVFRVPAKSIVDALGPVVLPVFAVFFADSGARLQLYDVMRIGVFALVLALVRSGAIATSVRSVARRLGTEDRIQRWLPFATFSQVGIAAGLAIMLERHFPTWGPSARPLVATVVVINQLVGPILLRTILVRSGESHGVAAAGEAVIPSTVGATVRS